MTTLGEIFRRYGPAYRARFGRALSTSQLQAMQAIAQCRTEALGGHVYRCPSCQFTRYSFPRLFPTIFGHLSLGACFTGPYTPPNSIRA